MTNSAWHHAGYNGPPPGVHEEMSAADTERIIRHIKDAKITALENDIADLKNALALSEANRIVFVWLFWTLAIPALPYLVYTLLLR